jgi:hypothetical protein
MWHYEYTIDRMLFRFPADSFEACVTALLVARGSSPLIRDPKIFSGGSKAVGSGSKVFDQHEPVGYARTSAVAATADEGTVAA